MWIFENIIEFYRYAGLSIEYFGLALVLVFVLTAVAKVPMKRFTIESIRVSLAKRIIFALEFIIAGDIILATVATNLDDIIRLGGIVLIRVVLGYALGKEAIR